MRVLQCHSQGDEIGRQGSAFNAKLDCGQTIERLYQSAKRDANGKAYPKVQEKGKPAYALHICGENIPCVGGRRICYQWYTMLWQVWFFENPKCFQIFCKYEAFADKFDGAGGKVYRIGDDYQPANGRCAQSASIAYLVGHDNCIEDVLPIVEQSYAKYCDKYHPNCMQLVLK